MEVSVEKVVAPRGPTLGRGNKKTPHCCGWDPDNKNSYYGAPSHWPAHFFAKKVLAWLCDHFVG